MICIGGRGGQILICIGGRGYYQEWGKEWLEAVDDEQYGQLK